MQDLNPRDWCSSFDKQVLVGSLALLILLTCTGVGASVNVPRVQICDLNLLIVVQPVYPARAAARGIEGYALLEFFVDLNGSPSDATVIEAEPMGIFDGASIRAVERWLFAPRLAGGVVRTRVRLDFRLGKNGAELGPCEDVFRDGFEP